MPVRRALSALAAASLLVLQHSYGQTATISTFAGNGGNVTSIPDGIAAKSAAISYPLDLDVDTQGNIYFVYSPDGFGVGGTQDVYRISAAGTVSKSFQLPAFAGLSWAQGVGVAPAGDAVYATNYYAGTLYPVKATSTGQTRIGTNYFSTSSAGLSVVAGIRVKNNLVYVTDPVGNRIVPVGSDNVATVIAGTGAGGYAGDGGAATQAKLNSPQAVAVDAAGVVYVADTSNHCIRRISVSGTISTVAGVCLSKGFSGDGGLATSARLSQPAGIAVSSAGVIYLSDSGNNRVRRINTDGSIETVAGGGQCDGGGFNCVLGDGGAATIGTLKNPLGMAFDSQGRLYVADSGNNRIRMLTFGVTPSSSAPKISANGIVNAASYGAAISPGTWVAIFGTNFSSKPGRVWTTADFIGSKLPMTLDGVSVTMNGLPAAIYYVSSTQLDVQVPDGLPQGGVTVAVTTSAGTGTATVTHQATTPALFIALHYVLPDGSNLDFPAAVHLDGTLVGSPDFLPGSRPAAPGEIIEIFGTGYGPSNPFRPTGFLFDFALLDSLITVNIHGIRVLPLASALISPGLYQFNLKVPESLARNEFHGIQIGFLGGSQSQDGVYLPVK